MAARSFANRRRSAARTIAVALGGAVLCGAMFAGLEWRRATDDYPQAAPAPLAAGPLAPLVSNGRSAPSDRIVVLLVFDGLCRRLLESAPTPNLDRLSAAGSHTSAMLPVYPTLSLPNLTSLSTGCYPERHGIVSNRFIDPERGLYEHDKGDVSWLFGCEPINAVAERQGVRSAILGWVGATRGRQALASVVDEYRRPLPSIARRTERVLELLRQPDTSRPQLIVAYYHEPDQTLHEHAVGSAKSTAALRAVDAAVGQVLDAIAAAGLGERAVLMVASDHGMVEASDHVNVERILINAGIEARIAADGAIAHVYLEDPSTRDAAVAKLKGRKELTAFTPDRAPDHAHVGRSRRVGDFVIATAPGYYTFDRGQWPKELRWAALYGPELLKSRRFAGVHGYPPTTPGVQSVFYAAGAGIARGADLSGMQAIDVHPTIAALLGITPGQPTDGHARSELLAQAAGGGRDQ